jgi:hypothetical protein
MKYKVLTPRCTAAQPSIRSRQLYSPQAAVRVYIPVVAHLFVTTGVAPPTTTASPSRHRGIISFSSIAYTGAEPSSSSRGVVGGSPPGVWREASRGPGDIPFCIEVTALHSYFIRRGSQGCEPSILRAILFVH